MDLETVIHVAAIITSTLAVIVMVDAARCNIIAGLAIVTRSVGAL